jgi:RNA polymerase sigma-70 factor, ECF subfamily
VPDADLICRINRGDEKAFEILYYRHRDWLFRMAYRITGAPQLADDVLQELFCYFLGKFPGFVLQSNLRTFFYPVVRNLSLNAIKKARRYDGGPEAIAYLAELPEQSTNIEPNNSLKAITEGLSEEHREVLLLRFIDGMTLPEIADLTGIPLGTAKSRLHHALALLRKNRVVKELSEKSERISLPRCYTLWNQRS